MVRNLERAEDIAAEAMAAGLPWTWASFAEYLDAVEAVPKGINYAASVGHSALRTWAMGERAFEETASQEDLAVMASGAVLRLAGRRSGLYDLSQLRPCHLRRPPGGVAAGVVGRGGGVGWDRRAQKATGCSSWRPKGFVTRRRRLDFSGDCKPVGAVEPGRPSCSACLPTRCRNLPSSLIDETVAMGGEMYGLTHCRGIVSGTVVPTRLGFDKLPSGRTCDAAVRSAAGAAHATPKCAADWFTPPITATMAGPSGRKPPDRTSTACESCNLSILPTPPSPKRPAGVGWTRSRR